MTAGPVGQKLIAIALLIGLGLASWEGLISPVMERFDQYEQSAGQSRLLIERYQRVLAGSAALKAEIAAIKKSRVLNQGLLVAPSAELGAAILQGKIKSSVALGAAELVSVQVLASKPETDFTRVTVRARIKGGIAALQAAFHSLETAWPSLVIDNVNIRARTRRSRRRRETPAKLTVDSILSIRFDAYGFMARQPPASTTERGKGDR